MTRIAKLTKSISLKKIYFYITSTQKQYILQDKLRFKYITNTSLVLFNGHVKP